ncbi:helix-turn-helix domain-containing protein [Draconibacterium sp. IB214405]|uniref:helix-turn-helix domain-containing protein n=1 Tax=Draconibacterium sp. IB214405 TaxID=3097352 RepID=UPI002A0AA297|nr:helix-turn-helix domain-containing protein [Draconibacterium sp. IB214405]MDX8340118.1 helix-turn-helix domain-containing protein [Draconibacterium sp. IB214405]
MDPLNKQERTQAVLKMLLFFVLAVIIVAIPMYYAFRMPELESEWNSEQYEDALKKLAENETFEREFLRKTDSAIALFTAFQIEEDEVARDKIQLRYSNATNQMEDYLQKIEEDSVRADLYDNIIYTFNNLFSAWNEKVELEKEMNKSQSKQQELKEKITEHSQKIEEEEAKSLQEKEIDLIQKALDKYNGSKRLAAQDLGTTERKLRKRMKELGMID